MKPTNAHAPRPKKNKDTLHNEEWLRHHYLDLDMNAAELGRMLGCSRNSVHWALEKFGLPRRTLSEAKKGRTPSVPVWTPERKADLAEKRKGIGNPMWGRRKERPVLEPVERVGNYKPRHRLSRYGMTQAEYDAIFEAQGGVCAICKKPESRKPGGGHPQLGKGVRIVGQTPESTTLAVDHDHETMKIRGLLCHGCNIALGHFKDDPALLRAAIDYLASG